MKTVLLFLFLPLFSNAQNAEQYCNAVIGNKLLSRKVVLYVDFGEESKLITNLALQDSTGKDLLFNSSIDALNYLGRAGWKLLDVTSVLEGTNTVKHYLFKREIDLPGAEKMSTNKSN